MARGLRTIGVGTALAWALAAGNAHAVGSLSSHGHTPLEQRVVLAVGPQRTTLWSQLRLRAEPGLVAVVVPAAPGAALDWATPAFTEALELATAPRIVPPDGTTGVCEGDHVPPDVTDVVGVLYHEPVLEAEEVVTLSDAAAVVAWATAHGMNVSPDLEIGMVGLGDVRFVVASFQAAGGDVLTPTLRVVAPAPAPFLPFVLGQATDAVLDVTVWTIADGHAHLDGTAVTVDPDDLVYDAESGETNYESVRAAALAPYGPHAWLTECASRGALVAPVDLPTTDHVVPPVVESYFAAGALYDLGGFDAKACTEAALAALALQAPVAASCPRAELGIVDGIGSCSEAPLRGEVAPEALRCGSADDLAVALSGIEAASAELTRLAMRIAPGSTGFSEPVDVITGATTVTPVLEAGDIDLDSCEEPPAEPLPDDPSHTATVPVYRRDRGCGSAPAAAPAYWTTVEVDSGEEAPEAYYADTDCSGNTSGTRAVYDSGSSSTPATGDGSSSADSGTSGDDCDSGSSSSSTSGDDCGGDSGTTSSGDDCSSDSGSSSGDDCDSYEGESDSCDSGSGSSGGDDCGGSSSGGGDDCGGGSSGGGESCDLGDCSIGHRRVRPRLSILVMALISLLTPLRRFTRRR
jgi:hypothetical protein